jgi:acetyl-CoA acyltransferase
MREAVVVEAIRTPIGRRNGALSGWHPVDLLGHTLKALVERTGIDPELVDDVIGGCVSQIGEQSINVTRHGWLAAGLPESVPATTVDRQCGSGQQAAHFAAQGVLSGAYDIAVACGVESMTRVPMGSSVNGADPWGTALKERYAATGLVPQGISAEMIAARWDVGRAELDEWSLQSHRRAAAARDAGAFDDELVPVPLDGGALTRDEGIRDDTSLEKLAKLAPSFWSEAAAAKFPELRWVVTAGGASQISDGAAAMLIMTPEKARELGLTPRWRFTAFALAATDPVTMLTGPIPATQRVLARAGMAVADIDHFEVNEAFAPVIAAWLRETKADPERTNPRGGAIALGHPLGASGVRLMTTMLHALEQTGGRFGLQTMCEGGGLANGTILERLG